MSDMTRRQFTKLLTSLVPAIWGAAKLAPGEPAVAAESPGGYVKLRHPELGIETTLLADEPSSFYYYGFGIPPEDTIALEDERWLT